MKQKISDFFINFSLTLLVVVITKDMGWKFFGKIQADLTVNNPVEFAHFCAIHICAHIRGWK